MRIALTCSIKPLVLKEGETEDLYAEMDSEATINDLKQAIESHGHNVSIINTNDDFIETLNNNKDNIDFVFNIAEGLKGEFRESMVQVHCDYLGIPYHGPGPLTAAIALNKAKTKEVLLANNIPTPKFQVFYTGREVLRNDLTYPLIIKPMLEGSSKGIFNENLVHDDEKLRKISGKLLRKYHQPVIVEEFLTGREFTVSVIGNKNPTVLPIVEITFHHLPEGLHPMDSYEAKWIYDNPTSQVDPLVCPAKITPALQKKIRDVAKRTFAVLECKDWTRIDIRLDSQEEPQVLEVNALPGLMKDPKENSRLPRAAYTAGWTYEHLIGTVLNSALKRKGLLQESSQTTKVKIPSVPTTLE